MPLPTLPVTTLQEVYANSLIYILLTHITIYEHREGVNPIACKNKVILYTGFCISIFSKMSTVISPNLSLLMVIFYPRVRIAMLYSTSLIDRCVFTLFPQFSRAAILEYKALHTDAFISMH